MSWLEFNRRVLEQATADEVPLAEKIKFYSIYTSNLDEYVMVRVGCLKHRAIYDKSYSDDKTGWDADTLLKAIRKRIISLEEKKYEIYIGLLEQLAAANIKKEKFATLPKSAKKCLLDEYSDEISKKVPAYILDANHPFPHLENLVTYLILRMENSEKSKRYDNEKYAILKISDEITPIAVMEIDGIKIWISISELIEKYYEDKLKKYKIVESLAFRITRNADIDFSDEYGQSADMDDDEVRNMRKMLKKRSKSSIIRLEYSKTEVKNDSKILEYLAKNTNLKPSQIYQISEILPQKWSSKIAELLKAADENQAYFPIQPIRRLNENSIIEDAAKNDILLAYPYHSFDDYLELLRDAIYKFEAKSIKITLYRMSRYTEIVPLLKAACSKGISVTAVIELKARFDEESNAHWGDVLRESGCKVIYGLANYKIHSKVTLITLKEQYCASQIAHIGTGNYNEITSKQYTDLGLFTTNSDICRDCEKLFESLETGVFRSDYERLLVSPTCLRSEIIDQIRIEKNAVKSGKNGYICLKMNSLTDKVLIDELLEAAEDGVKIDLIVRGICCLRPSSENINVVSIVGRYLEHSRIYIFGDNDQNRRVFIGSADLMTRNTMRRVEVLTPILNEQIAQMLYKITRLQLSDNVKLRKLKPNGKYKKIESQGEQPCDSQMELYNLLKCSE